MPKDYKNIKTRDSAPGTVVSHVLSMLTGLCLGLLGAQLETSNLSQTMDADRQATDPTIIPQAIPQATDSPKTATLSKSHKSLL